MRRALATADLNIEELGDQSGLGRQVVGRIVRGETRRIAPDQAKRLTSHLPITMEQLLVACGYEMGVAPSRKIPPALVDAYLKLSPDDQRQLVRSAQALAAYRPAEGDPL